MFGAIVMFYITFKHRYLVQILHHCCHKDKMSRRELISFYKSGEITKGDKALTIRWDCSYRHCQHHDHLHHHVHLCQALIIRWVLTSENTFRVWSYHIWYFLHLLNSIYFQQLNDCKPCGDNLCGRYPYHRHYCGVPGGHKYFTARSVLKGHSNFSPNYDRI